eukprot:4603-Heterococcus_DN1.PRE.1
MKLGLNFAAGERPHFTVKGGSWFGSCLEKRDAPAATAGDSSATTSSSNSDDTPYVLAGCTVAPGFDFADFELPTRHKAVPAAAAAATAAATAAAAVTDSAAGSSLFGS